MLTITPSVVISTIIQWLAYIRRTANPNTLLWIGVSGTRVASMALLIRTTVLLISFCIKGIFYGFSYQCLIPFLSIHFFFVSSRVKNSFCVILDLWEIEISVVFASECMGTGLLKILPSHLDAKAILMNRIWYFVHIISC